MRSEATERLGGHEMILVTGAAGMVGSYLLDVYDQDELYRTDVLSDLERGIYALDIRDRKQVLETIEKVQPRLVIHLAAETNVDRCEQDRDHAYRTNFFGTQNIAQACERFGIELLYVSTAGVFDGNKPEPYIEFDSPAPVSVYARTKWEGEKIVQCLHPHHYIVRAGWIFGGNSKDHKFVGKIAELCRSRDEIQVVDDKVGNPTYAKDLVRNMKVLTETGLYGLYHVVGEGWCSRFEVAREVASFIGRDVRVRPVSSAAFPLPAPRPRSEAARSYKLDLLGLNQMRPWKDALHDYLGSWTNGS